MLLDLLQYITISSVPLLLLQGLLSLQVLLTVVCIVVRHVTVAPSSFLLIAVAKVDNLPQAGATLLTIHGCGTYPAPFGILFNWLHNAWTLFPTASSPLFVIYRLMLSPLVCLLLIPQFV